MKWSMELDLKTLFGHPIWIFRTSFCHARSIKGKRVATVGTRWKTVEKIEVLPSSYGKENVSLKDESIRRIKKREVLKHFYNFFYVTRHNVVEIKTNSNINTGEELFA